MVTAVVLAKNDRKSLDRTLQSLMWCSERIVVDDYSHENIAPVAKKYAARYYKRRVNEDFAAQRNFALSKARYPWVFFVDSDEVVTHELASEISTEVKVSGDVVGYYVQRIDYLFGKRMQFGETRKMLLLRLAKKSAGQWVRPVHEVWEVQGKVKTLETPLVHNPHPTVGSFLTDINRYSTINAQHLYDTGRNVFWWHIIAYPAGKFLQNYIGRKGYKDGMPGLLQAGMMSLHSFLTRAKLWQLRDSARGIT